MSIFRIGGAGAEEMLYRVACSREQFSFQMCLESGDGNGTFRTETESSRQLVLGC